MPTPPDSPASSTNSFLTSTTVIVLAIVACAIVPYVGAIQGEFVWTDKHFVEGNASLDQWSTLPRMFVEDAWSIGGEARRIGYYRPIRNLTFLLDTKLFGTEPIGYHITNLLLHAACSVLVFVIIELVFGRRALAAWAALLFAVHPVHTEAVAWITGRTDTVSALGYFAALGCWLKAYGERTRWGWWLAGCLAAAWGLLGKESAATLCGGLALCLWLRNAHGDRSLPRLIVRCVPPVVLTVAYLAARGAVLQSVSNHGPWGDTWSSNALTAVSLLATYVPLLVRGGPLVAVYEEHVYRSFSDQPVLIGGVLLFLLLLAMLTYRRLPTVAFAGAWTLITLAPVMQIIPFKVLLAERFLYIPSVGWCVLAASGITWIAARSASAGWAIGVALLAFYGQATVARVPYWLDDITLFTDSLATHPDSFEARTELGEAYLDAGKPDDAYTQFWAAKTLRPDYYLAWYNLGLADQRSIRSRGATFNFQMAATLRPELTDMWYAYANAAYTEGDYAAASRGWNVVAERVPREDNFQWLIRSMVLSGEETEAAETVRSLERQPGLSPAFVAEGAHVLTLAGDADAAERWLKRVGPDRSPAIQSLRDQLEVVLSRGDRQTGLHLSRVLLLLRPDDWPLLVATIDRFNETHPAVVYELVEDFAQRHPENLAAMVTYVRLALDRDAGTAARAAQQLVDNHPDAAAAHVTFARERRAAGDLEAALQATETAHQLDPTLMEALLLRGELAMQRQDLPMAIGAFEQVLQRVPRSRPALQQLARAYLATGRSADALAVAQRGLHIFPEDATLLAVAERAER